MAEENESEKYVRDTETILSEIYFSLNNSNFNAYTEESLGVLLSAHCALELQYPDESERIIDPIVKSIENRANSSSEELKKVKSYYIDMTKNKINLQFKDGSNKDYGLHHIEDIVSFLGGPSKKDYGFYFIVSFLLQKEIFESMQVLRSVQK